MSGDLFMRSDAAFSPKREYRYQLRRIWDQSRPICAFVMLNPSTADEEANDQTSRKCMGYAARWGNGGVIQANLFALRGSDSSVLLRSPAPIGPDNDLWLEQTAREAGLVVAAWGAHKAVVQREAQVVELLRRIKPLHCLRMTASGHPEHPCYTPGALEPVPLQWGRAA